MTGTRARPPAGGPELTHQEGRNISLLDGLRHVAHSAQMPFLAYLINVALEEANNKKTNRD